MIRQLRALWTARAMRRRVVAELARRRGEVIEVDRFRVDLGVLAAAMLAARPDADETGALLADPAAQVARVVRQLAVDALDRPHPLEVDRLTDQHDVVSAAVAIAGVLDFGCERCGRRYPGRELHIHRDSTAFSSTHEGRCPAGHALPALAMETVYR
jgi:hypothetical protein